MSNGEDLLSFLREHPAWRREMVRELQGDPNRICAYYLCPLSTLARIAQEGIKCRHAPKDTLDLSSPDIQSRRRDVWLGRWDRDRIRWKPRVAVHACVNLFWNPLNRTFEAFQRNALLRAEATGSEADGVVCIIEIDAERILTDGVLWWCATNRNLASGGFTSCQLHDLRDSGRFDWPSIFSPGRGEHAESDARRAAELVVYVDGPGEPYSAPLSPALYRRAVCPPGVPLCTDHCAGLPVTRVPVFKQKRELLHAELQLIGSTLARLNRQTCEVLLSCMAGAFRDMVAFEDSANGLCPTDFANQDMAHGLHGIGHAVRVMFWVAVLSRYAGTAGVERTLVAALTAARCHDLCRDTYEAAQPHGAAAAEAQDAFVRAAVRDDELAAQCLNAIAMHDLPDEAAPPAERTHVWEVLKDADALERGRFGYPNSRIGCHAGLLRTSSLRRQADPRSRIVWAAYWLARMTRSTQWADSPCRNWIAEVGLGVRAALRADLLQSDNERDIARYLSEAALGRIGGR